MTGSFDDLLDLRHAATDRATIVTVPERRMLALDGIGAPTGTDFGRAVETLYGVADRLRARLHARGLDARIGAMECAWWQHPEPTPDEMPERFADRSTWHWQLMTEIPRQAGEDEVDAVVEEASTAIDHAGHVRPIRFAEGRSAQVLQLGGPATAERAVALLFAEVAAAGAHSHGHLHEIHLTDPRRVSPDRWRVILRLPIEAA